MQFNPYGGTAAQLAAALVNAGSDAPRERFNEILATYDYQPGDDVTDAQAQELSAWSRRLRAIFEEPTLSRRVDLANALLSDAAAPPYISQHDGRAPHFHYAEHDAQLVFRIKAYTAGGLAHALCHEAHRLGRCQRPGCDVVYVDTSRNGRRRFCTNGCANRTRVAEHRRRGVESRAEKQRRPDSEESGRPGWGE